MSAAVKNEVPLKMAWSKIDSNPRDASELPPLMATSRAAIDETAPTRSRSCTVSDSDVVGVIGTIRPFWYVPGREIDCRSRYSPSDGGQPTKIQRAGQLPCLS